MNKKRIFNWYIMRKVLLTVCICACRFSLFAQQHQKTALLKDKNFNVEIDGKKVHLYTLNNKNGVTAQFTNYGGRWLSIWTPDVRGIFSDLILGFDNIKGYQHAAEKYHGAITGRICGRINNGVFELEGQTYHLANNDFFGSPVKNHLHGGIEGFHKKMWDAEQGVNENNEPYIRFSYLSKDGEEGYPGNLNVNVRYTLSEANALRIEYQATTDQTTLVNLTNHAYFNLSGNPAQSVSNHILYVNADKYVECDKELVPTGNIIPLKGLPIDFSIPTAVGANLDAYFPEMMKGKGFAIAYAINPSKEELGLVARLTDPESGRTMDVYSNQPSLQVYNAWLMDGTDTGKNNISYHCGAGIVLETQGFPDAPNHPAFPQVTLKPEEVYRHIAVYDFGITSDK
ncbi:MAG: galactose mutarotase [Candidatus Symbiothrix sp.]|nr:galactose mutarotase [Candidatus Symbiothrix sp.]